MNRDPDVTMDTIGATALGVALARSVEGQRPDRLFDDPYAAEFIAAASRLSPVAQSMLTATTTAGPWAFLSHHVAIRTRFFDDCLHAAAASCAQVVLVAAGLDTRALRIDWPAGTRVFELDQAPVLAFKDDVLGSRATPAGRIPVPVNLREEWSPVLLEAGFDAGRRSAWLIEGLFPSLSAAESDLLMSRVSELAAPGSQLAYEDTGDTATMARMLAQLGPTFVELWKGGSREHPAVWLGRYGWEADVLDQEDVARRHRRQASPALVDTHMPRPRLILARKAAAR